MAKPDHKDIRKSMRKNRVSIDDKYVGPEPVFSADTMPEGQKARSLAWGNAAFWFNYHYKGKDYIPYIMNMAQEVYGYDKPQIRVMKNLKDWEFGFLTNASRIWAAGWVYTTEEIERFRLEFKRVHALAVECCTTGDDGDDTDDVAVVVKAPVISPAERTRLKVNDTILMAWDEEVVDQWMEGNYKITFDMYGLFKKNGLKSNAIKYIDAVIRVQYDEILSAYDKTCEQCVEAYEYVTRRNQKKMLTLMEGIFADLESIKNSAKATRAPKAKKPKASDAQVKNLKFRKEDITAKLSSINPMLIPGKARLWVYNTKTRKLSEFFSDSVKGFEVSGTSIKNFSPELSKCTTLRKPEDVLPSILTKTAKQIDKVWATKITTKITEPNGRINADCILLRIMEK